MSSNINTYNFVKQSNRIEGILREPLEAELEEYERFMLQDDISISELIQFVRVYQPNAEIRQRKGLDVRVGTHIPPKGGIKIIQHLSNILDIANITKIDGTSRERAFEVHQLYEQLHPFTDGNGRSGRMLWMWMMREAPLGFLHHWYYQSLTNWRKV